MPNRTHISPSFAREAAGHLSDGNVQRAIDLCLEGTKVFPAYATGYLVLGKCYEAFGRNREALTHYREALLKLPDNSTLQELVQRLEQQQQEEFRSFLEEQEKRLGQATPEVRGEPVEPAKQVEPGQITEESTVEYLAKRLQNVKRVQPSQETESDFTHSMKEKNISFVTPTMAEILASQEKYEEAITAYKELVAQQPDPRYVKRLAELEELQTHKRHKTDGAEKTKASQ